jgi:hypothetical protein
MLVQWFLVPRDVATCGCPPKCVHRENSGVAEQSPNAENFAVNLAAGCANT